LKRITFWRKWLSHFKPVIIEETGSERNPELTVLLDRGRLQLQSGDAIYSWDDLYYNFGLAFLDLHIEKRDIADVLVLGFGLGSVPFILETKHGMHCYYTAVEWDETVADLATRYTLNRLESPINLIVADATLFVEITEERYDLVVVDIFEDRRTPPEVETRAFLEACGECLRPGGLLLFNRLYQSKTDRLDTEHFYEGTFRSVFPEANKISTGGNWILYWEKP
jgi:spermidine synthase